MGAAASMHAPSYSRYYCHECHALFDITDEEQVRCVACGSSFVEQCQEPQLEVIALPGELRTARQRARQSAALSLLERHLLTAEQLLADLRAHAAAGGLPSSSSLDDSLQASLESYETALAPASKKALASLCDPHAHTGEHASYWKERNPSCAICLEAFDPELLEKGYCPAVGKKEKEAGSRGEEEDDEDEDEDEDEDGGDDDCKGKGAAKGESDPDGSRISMIPGCGHVFHHACLLRWLSSSASCPVCRLKMEKEQAAAEEDGRGGADVTGAFEGRTPLYIGQEQQEGEEEGKDSSSGDDRSSSAATVGGLRFAGGGGGGGRAARMVGRIDDGGRVGVTVVPIGGGGGAGGGGGGGGDRGSRSIGDGLGGPSAAIAFHAPGVGPPGPEGDDGGGSGGVGNSSPRTRRPFQEAMAERARLSRALAAVAAVDELDARLAEAEQLARLGLAEAELFESQDDDDDDDDDDDEAGSQPSVPLSVT